MAAIRSQTELGKCEFQVDMELKQIEFCVDPVFVRDLRALGESLYISIFCTTGNITMA